MGDFRALALEAAQVMTGAFGWAPEIFWDSTPLEVALALRGRMAPGSDVPMALVAGELARLQREMPDG